MMNKKYSKNTKDIARKAIGGDDEAMNLLIIELPSGVATDKPNLKTQAKEVAGDDEADGTKTKTKTKSTALFWTRSWARFQTLSWTRSS